MDFDSTDVFKILFDGPEDPNSGPSLAAINSNVQTLLQDHPYVSLPNKPRSWPAGQLQRLPDDDDAEELLQLRINPNKVYHPRSSTASPENIGDVSSSLGRAPLPHDPSPTIVLEVLCDPGTLEDINTLGNWGSPETHPPICIASQASLEFLDGRSRLNAVEIPTEQTPAPFLTEEERHLLSQEGVFLHDVLHLSQAEERILKKIRRKIRNKHSAQDSRRRKKEYLDGLESRVAACSAQNQDLKKKVQQLEKHKESLLDQLQNLQGLLTQTSTKAVQTSTCLVILLVSFGLFIWPTLASFYGASQVAGGNPEPSGVLSRNILTQKEASEPGTPSAARHLEVPLVQVELRPELRVGEDVKNLPVVGETDEEAGSEPQFQPKDRRRGKATRPDLDEI
ncbi:cyclic AMP-responsive element-binding protein 3-like protein 4 isoform X2 [Thamnophis elegans]|uniref:cyclic AMP-responsive element-binding protein 3-like protein 4 isoform X2 n=1 Tax=Thamnophis elegans TaxID=35005 RepID=UPI0013790E43|nr:cyclic AMP-responsive element-binding protein 3-like protein 4 isoform X2 [Thamnophis elegans]